MRKRRQFRAGRCYHLVSRIAHRAFFFIHRGLTLLFMMRQMKMESGLYCNEGWAKTKAKEALEKEIIREFAKFSQDEKKEQVKFDTETNHGVISDKEAEWEKRYDVH